MKSVTSLKHIPFAILLAYGMTHFGLAQAALVSGACLVNDINVCQDPNATVPAAGILTIRGYAFDMASGDRFVEGSGAYVLVRNEDTLAIYKLPIQRSEARPDVVAASITGTITASQYEMVNSGFIAQVFMASLPPGRYTVQEVKVNMKLSGLTKLPIESANERAAFNIGSGDSPFRLIKTDGTSVPLSMGKASNGVIPATGYPALRDGTYQVQAALPSVSGPLLKTVDFVYKRPVLAVPVSLPIVEDFPGVTTRMSPTNPLNNRALDLTAVPVVVEEVQGTNTKLNGEPLEVGKAIELPRQQSVAGVYPLSIRDDGDVEQQQTVKLWVNLPDAPNINLVSNRWNPASKISVTASKATAAIKVEDLDVAAKLEGGSTDTCQTLSMVRPDYMLSQTSGVNCAIKYGDLPEGLKYNPYAANALRGSVPVVGPNVFDYTPGVVYTDPATRKTAFYPVKTGSKQISIAGTTPAPIQLAFKNDRLLDGIYSKNAAQYPGKFFATVDRAQPRTLGVMNVKGGYREIMTRITYPGAENVKEVYSSIADSNVALQMQADEPWRTYKVKVESWYQKAPEFITTEEMDFVGVPLTPIVDLEKAFASHDKADTVISGQLGLSKGQSLVFDPAGMGAWQVFIREEKSETPLGTPVAVGADGTFSINLGRLSAGTRIIVAEAKMVDGSGLVSNSSVVSKSRALVTAVGDTIEATLSARSLSGKAPFVQTINANLKNSKMLSSVKAVSWERMKDDGSWERVMRNETTEYVGVNYTATLADVGKASYRAVLTNKFSGAEYVTEPISLQAFAVPSFSIKAPGVVQVNRPVTLEVQADEGFDAAFTWKMVTTGGFTEVSADNGTTFSFTPTELKNYVIEVSGRSANAPENPAAVVTKTVGVKAVNPLAARASITGPTYLEAGKTYSYKATINDVVPTGSNKAYKVLGYWMLPDGTRVDGTELSFTPRTGDTTLSYYTYVEGYPEETTVATLGFKAWTYTWPTNWRIRLQPTLLDVPAQVKFFVEAPDFDLKSLNGEPLTYTWALPQDVTRTSGADTAGTLTISKNGTYQIAVQVADTRGNVVNVMSDEFTILPAASVKTQASIVSKYGAAYYAPGTYYVSLKISEMPRGDSFLRNEILINGAKVGEFTGSGNYVSFADPGSYEVVIRTITKAGNYGEQAMTVPVSAAPAPACDIKQATTTSGVLITPLCTVAVGYIKSLTWNYKLDGVDQKATSKSFLVTKDWINNSRLRELTLTIETDLGAVSTYPVQIN